MSEGVSVKLGASRYEVAPQGIGRIKRKLGKLLGLAQGEAAFDGELDAEVYGVLKTFIPELAPLHTLLGYESEEAYKADEEPEGGIEEVTLPELLDAIQTIYTVNGADRLVRLGKGLGLDADLIRSLVQKELASWALARSASSPSPSGELDLESSTTPDPTPPSPSEPPSPSPDSSISLKPETPVGVPS